MLAASTSGTLTCADPTSSVLFDDPSGMPILTGLDGDMWASQLLTIQTTASSIDITFDFREVPNFIRLERVEVVMFNCPQWGIGAQVIQAVQHATIISIIVPSITSCDSLVRVCIPFRATTPTFTLRLLGPALSWYHIAEIGFIDDNPTCPVDIVLAPPTAPPTSTEPSPDITTTTTRSQQETTAHTTDVTTLQPTQPTQLN